MKLLKMGKIVDKLLFVISFCGVCSCQRVIFENTPVGQCFPENISCVYGLGKIEIEDPAVIILDDIPYILDYESATHLSIDSLKNYYGLLKYVYDDETFYARTPTERGGNPFHFTDVAYENFRQLNNYYDGPKYHIRLEETVNGVDIYDFIVDPDYFILLSLSEDQGTIWCDDVGVGYRFSNRYVLGAVPIYSNKKKKIIGGYYYLESGLHKMWRYLTWRLR